MIPPKVNMFFQLGLITRLTPSRSQWDTYVGLESSITRQRRTQAFSDNLALQLGVR